MHYTIENTSIWKANTQEEQGLLYWAALFIPLEMCLGAQLEFLEATDRSRNDYKNPFMHNMDTQELMPNNLLSLLWCKWQSLGLKNITGLPQFIVLPVKSTNIVHFKDVASITPTLEKRAQSSSNWYATNRQDEMVENHERSIWSLIHRVRYVGLTYHKILAFPTKLLTKKTTRIEGLSYILEGQFLSCDCMKTRVVFSITNKSHDLCLSSKLEWSAKLRLEMTAYLLPRYKMVH